MKVAAYILVFILACSTVLPVFAVTKMSMQKNTKVSSCKKKSTCSKPAKKCEKKEKQKDCESQMCNPFMACSNYNLFLLTKTGLADYVLLLKKKQKIAVVNDNRLAYNLSECWHPPNGRLII